jgi:hypothetical protein
MKKIEMLVVSFSLMGILAACGNSHSTLKTDADNNSAGTPNTTNEIADNNNSTESTTIDTNGMDDASSGIDNNETTETTDVNVTTGTEETVVNTYKVFKTGEERSLLDGDDGALRVGAARSYIKNGNIVIDKITSLKWQDNETGRGDFTDAVKYCQNLVVDGVSGWRVPTLKELQTILDLGKSPKIDPIFSSAARGKFWSSNEYPYDSNNMAYYLDFSRGFSANYGEREDFLKSNRYAVRCVKGKDQRPESHFVSSGDIVTDTATDLMWEDTSHIEKRMSVEEGINYCKSLNLGGYDDWRLPNINELNTLSDITHYDPSTVSVFKNRMKIGTENSSSHYRAANFWSSTYYGSSVKEDQTIDYYRTYNERDGTSHRCRDYLGMHIRCVRGGK